jgi:hypothetical protein
MLCILGLYRLGNTHALYHGKTLQAGKHSCFVSGHDSSRAVEIQQNLGFSPWAFSLCPNGKTLCTVEIIADKCFVRDEP